MKAAIKQTTVHLACWGWLPPRGTYLALRMGRLLDA